MNFVEEVIRVMRRQRRRFARNHGGRPSNAIRPAAAFIGLEAIEPRVLLSGVDPAAHAALEVFNTSPALFIENRGQWDDQIHFLHQGDGASVAMTDTGPMFQVRRAVEDGSTSTSAMYQPLPDGIISLDFPWPEPGTPVDPAAALDGLAGQPTAFDVHQFGVTFVDGNTVAPIGLDQSGTTFNYHLGSADQWRSAVPSFQVVAYEGLYEGIDLHTWGLRSNLKYEFIVAPGADWTPIRIQYDGIAGLTLADDGSMVVALGDGWDPVTDAAPYVYQDINGERIEIAARFVLLDDMSYGFELLDAYDPAHVLVIDPDLAWSTYLGGTGGDYGYGIAVDGEGNVLVTGRTPSAGWVTGGHDTVHNDNTDAFVVKLAADGEHLWSTYLGGSANDIGHGIAVDGDGNVLVTGETESAGWVTDGHDTVFNGDVDAFVVKLAADGEHVWSTYLGGSDRDNGRGIAVDAAGNVLVTGITETFEWVTGGYDTTHNLGWDAFVVKLAADGEHLWSTYVGGSANDYGLGIAVDGDGHVLVTGYTTATSWITGGVGSGGGNDAFVVKLGTDGDHLWSTYLGASGNEIAYGIAVDGADNVLVMGRRLPPAGSPVGMAQTTTAAPPMSSW